MAKRGPGRPFTPGKSGNPKGSSQRTKTLAKVKALTNEQVLQVGSLLLDGNVAGLKRMMGDTNASVLQVWLANLIDKSMAEGDSGIFNVLMTRFLGRPAETKTILGADGGPLNLRISEETDEEKIARAEKLRRMRLAVGEDI